LLGREADPAGLAGWSQVVMNGKPTTDVVIGLMTSPEFASQHASTTDFIQFAYRNLLGREADASLSVWADMMAGGFSRASLITAVLSSPEAVHRLTRSAYITFFERDPGQAELDAWFQVLAASGASSSEFIADFLNGTEFRAKAATHQA
jgi:hypothetical protein